MKVFLARRAIIDFVKSAFQTEINNNIVYKLEVGEGLGLGKGAILN